MVQLVILKVILFNSQSMSLRLARHFNIVIDVLTRNLALDKSMKFVRLLIFWFANREVLLADRLSFRWIERLGDDSQTFTI